MLGLAQQLFKEREGRFLVKPHAASPSKWPVLETYLSNGQLPYVDFALTKLLLQQFPDATQEAALFLCHLSLASRNGHLCIYLDNDQLLPEPQTIWQSTDEESTLDLDKLKAMILQGAQDLPKQLIDDMNDIESSTCQPVCKNGGNFYFQRNWIYESHFLKSFHEIIHDLPELQCEAEVIKAKVQCLQVQGKLLEEQADAIVKACKNRLSIICGGPGTGKTYTAAYLIKTFWEALPESQRSHCEIALAAPTGKAAANLQKSLGRVMESLQGFKPVSAKTLHTLLGIKGPKTYYNDEDPVLSADLVLVDECSMIDVQVMVRLLSSIKPGARLVLLGDKYQLPPVGSGALFADMITCLEAIAQPPSTLKTCLRAELKGILDLAHAVNAGQSHQAIKLLESQDALPGVVRAHLENDGVNKRQALNKFIEHVSENYEYPKSSEAESGQILEAFNRFRILSPMRKGPYGVDDLNEKIRNHQFKKFQSRHAFLAPIMIQYNDKRLELFNGEVGVLVKFNHEDSEDDFHEGDYAVFPGIGDGPPRKLPAVMLPRFEYAYCLSVHKSQGSEFDHVLLLLPEGSEVFGREVLYTAVTRARKMLEVHCEDSVMIQTIERHSCRLSGVIGRFMKGLKVPQKEKR